MAEIQNNDEQKAPWPWFIGIIIIAIFIWIMLTYVYIPNDNGFNRAAGFSTHYKKNEYRPPVDTMNEVEEFIDFSRDTSSPLSNKHYTEKGLIKLQSALSYIADRINTSNNIIKKNIDTLDRKVAEIDTSSANYLRELKPAFSCAIKAMAAFQKLNYPDLAVNILNLRNTENSINERSSVKFQLIKIKRFFSEAGVTLQQMKLSYTYNKASEQSGILVRNNGN